MRARYVAVAYAAAALVGVGIGYVLDVRLPDHSPARPVASVTVTASAPAALPRRVTAHDKAAPEGPYLGTITNIHDGDTVTIEDDTGFDNKHTFHCRVRTMTQGINAPELNTAAGKDALAYALTLVAVGDRVVNYDFGDDKYGGRRDCDFRTVKGADFGQAMLDTGHAVPYKP